MASPPHALGSRPEPDQQALGQAVDVVLHRPSTVEMVRDVWRVRALVLRLGIRATIKSIAGTKLGRSWILLRPLISTFGLALLFGGILGTPSNGVPYIVFLMVGMHGWMAFERTAFWGVRSFDLFRRVVRTFYFPLLVVPTAGIVPAAIEWLVFGAMAVTTLLVVSLLDGNLYVELGPGLALAALGYVLAFAVAYVVSLFLAPLNARARDVRIIFRFTLQPWMFITPVVYPIAEMPESLRWLVTLNPVAAPVELVRYGVLGVGEIPYDALAVSLGTVFVLGLAGLWFFTRSAPELLSRQALADDDELA